MNKKWVANDIFWAGVFISIGLFLVFAVYAIIQLWKNSTLRQLLF